MRDFRQFLDVADIARGIADGFGKHGLGVFVDQSFDGVGTVAVGETPGDALARQHMAEQGMGRAVKLGHGDDVAADVGESHEGKMQRGLAAGDCKGANAAFELGNALFQHGGGRIGDAAVAKALGFEIEQGGAVVGAVESIGGGLIDRNGDGVGGRIRVVAGVNGNRLIAHSRPPPQRGFLGKRFAPLSCLEARGEVGNNSRQDRRNNPNEMRLID